MFENKNLRIELWQRQIGFSLLQETTTARFDSDDDFDVVINTMYQTFLKGAQSSEVKIEISLEVYAKAGNELIWKDGKHLSKELEHKNANIQVSG